MVCGWGVGGDDCDRVVMYAACVVHGVWEAVGMWGGGGPGVVFGMCGVSAGEGRVCGVQGSYVRVVW